MYPINDDTRQLFIDDNRQYVNITLTPTVGDSITINEANIVAGSFKIDKACASSNALTLGNCFANELEMTLFNDFEDVVFEGAENLIVRNTGARVSGDGKRQPLFMDGPEIFQFTLSVVPKTVKDLLEKENLTLDGIDIFVFHQANAFILEHLRKKLGIPREKFLLDMAETGNTVSASIPIALSRAIESKKIAAGMKMMADS